MAAQTLPLSLEEFHALYNGAKPAFEYWQGAAVQKPMPTALHGLVQIILAMLLGKAGWNTASEVRLKIVPNAEAVPDLIAFQGKLKGRYPTAAPALCIEIMSPRDTLAKALAKASTYLSWGSECAWIIDPEKRTAWSMVQGTADQPTWIAPDGVMRIRETIIELTTLFSQVDMQLDQTED